MAAMLPAVADSRTRIRDSVHATSRDQRAKMGGARSIRSAGACTPRGSSRHADQVARKFSPNPKPVSTIVNACSCGAAPPIATANRCRRGTRGAPAPVPSRRCDRRRRRCSTSVHRHCRRRPSPARLAASWTNARSTCRRNSRWPRLSTNASSVHSALSAMRFAYFDKLSRANQRIYLRSDAIETLGIPWDWRSGI